jgi:hypothetical protein
VLALVLGLAAAGCSAGSVDGGTLPLVTTPPPHGPTPEGNVPAGAFVAAADLGTSWHPAVALATPCAADYARSALRSTGLAEPRGTLTETLATGVDVPTAVASWKRSLQACGYAVHDDPLGDAGVTARSTDGADAVTATGTEGVLVVLHVHGALARATEELDGWADLALGTSCVAAPDGCH